MEKCFKSKMGHGPAIASTTDPYPAPHPHHRHWNRDTAAVQNFWHNIFSLRESTRISERFQRENTTSPANWSKKPIKRRKKSTKKPKTQTQKHSG
ncbi:hypothetical protein H4R24_005394 [Coemansia sp. RSA 988]|nr:hypothetical protein H4R24_005394 [Coemansia sp. RSA 988]